MKLKVQAQHLQPGDVVRSGEVVHSLILNSVRWPTSKICIRFKSKREDGTILNGLIGREVLWGKYTMINIERAEKEAMV